MAVDNHVVVLPSPGMGHIIPLLQFSTRLVTLHRLHVTFLVISDPVSSNTSSSAQTKLFRSSSLPPNLHVVHIPPVGELSDLIITHDVVHVLTRLSILVRESLRTLRSILLGLSTPPKALIIDIFTTDAFEVCRELSIPVYSFFTASTVLFAFSLYLPTLDQAVEEGEFVDLPEPIQVPGCKPIRTEDLPDPVKNRKIEEYKWYLLHVSRLPMAAGIFLNTWIDLEPDWFRAIKQEPFFHNIPTPPVHVIGPLVKEDEPFTGSDDLKILNWLDKQPCGSVLYVALGSGGTLTSEQLTELALGLEMSQQRFILVARKPSDTSASARFFDVGSDASDPIPLSYLPEGFVERTKGAGVVVASWAPQVEILGHGATGGFMSHCGWNSTLESVVHGVPMIAWPLYAEQRMNATMLAEEAGVAIKVAEGRDQRVVGREEIERVVRLVMGGDEGNRMRIKARDLQASAKVVLSSNGSSFETLAQVAESWKL